MNATYSRRQRDKLNRTRFSEQGALPSLPLLSALLHINQLSGTQTQRPILAIVLTGANRSVRLASSYNTHTVSLLLLCSSPARPSVITPGRNVKDQRIGTPTPGSRSASSPLPSDSAPIFFEPAQNWFKCETMRRIKAHTALANER